jgi:transposase
MRLLAALRADRIDAPCVIDGPINGESFLAYVEQVLVPTLKPGDIVIIDNLDSHEGKAVRGAIRAAVPSCSFYSPDLNPIEQVFAKLKTLLRKAAERTVEATWQRIGDLLSCFSATECANYIRNECRLPFAGQLQRLGDLRRRHLCGDPIPTCHRVFVPGRRRQVKPHVRDDIVPRGTLAHAVQDPEIDLSIDIALLGGFVIPTHRDRVVLRDTWTCPGFVEGCGLGVRVSGLRAFCSPV